MPIKSSVLCLCRFNANNTFLCTLQQTIYLCSESNNFSPKQPQQNIKKKTSNEINLNLWNATVDSIYVHKIALK